MLGGIKMEPKREDFILSAHHCLSSGVGPQASSTERVSGTTEMLDGCLGQDSSPGISDFGAGFSSTGMSGAPVRRLRTKTRPIFVEMAMAGILFFQVKSVGCAAT